MWTRKLLKTNAREVFTSNYWPTVLTYWVFGLVTGGATAILAFTGVGSLVVTIMLTGPMGASLCYYALRNRRGEGQLEDIFHCFKSEYGNIILVTFMKQLFVFLWSLLFVIPGIVKTYEYRMVPYLVAENPKIDYKEALERSRAMMDGEKWNAFVLDLSFLGWWLLTGFTGGLLAIFWTTPYVCSTNAELYEALKAKTGIDSGAATEQPFVQPAGPAGGETFVESTVVTQEAPQAPAAPQSSDPFASPFAANQNETPAPPTDIQ